MRKIYLLSSKTNLSSVSRGCLESTDLDSSSFRMWRTLKSQSRNNTKKKLRELQKTPQTNKKQTNKKDKNQNIEQNPPPFGERISDRWFSGCWSTVFQWALGLHPARIFGDKKDLYILQCQTPTGQVVCKNDINITIIKCISILWVTLFKMLYPHTISYPHSNKADGFYYIHF